MATPGGWGKGVFWWEPAAARGLVQRGYFDAEHNAQPVLEAFETMPFRSRLASPPAEGQDIQVRFFTRRDAVAGLN